MKRKNKQLTNQRPNNYPLEHNNIATTTDGITISCYINITNPPLTTTQLNTQKPHTLPTIPLHLLAHNLTQYDTTITQINIITHATKTRPTGFGPIYQATYNPHLFTTTNTIIETIINIENNLETFNQRKLTTDETIADTIVRTSILATERLRRKLIDKGYSATMMSYNDIEQYDTLISEAIGQTPFDYDTPNGFNVPNKPSVIYQIPIEHTFKLPPARKYTTLTTLVPSNDGNGEIATYVMLHQLLTKFTPPKEWKKPKNQGDITTNMLPLMMSVPITTSQFKAPTKAGQMTSAGVFMGEHEKYREDSVFIDVDSARSQVVYCSVSELFLKCLVLRSVACGFNVAVIDTTGVWDRWVREKQLKGVVVVDSALKLPAGVDVLVTSGRDVSREGIVSFVQVDEVPSDSRLSLESLGGGVHEVVSGFDRVRFVWVVSEQENSWLV